MAAESVWSGKTRVLVERLQQGYAGLQLTDIDADRRALTRYFLACVAAGLGALSSLAIVAMWVPQWVLSPCAG